MPDNRIIETGLDFFRHFNKTVDLEQRILIVSGFVTPGQM